MSVRMYRSGKDSEGKPRDIPGGRCVIGRHQIDHTKSNLPWFVMDGKVLCYRHTIEIMEATDIFRGQPGMSPIDMLRWRQKDDARKAIVSRKQSMRAIGGNDPGFVYYIRIDQHIKIGYATDIAKRMRAYPPSAVLLAAHPGTKATEKQMHQDFHAYLDRGREWFNPGKSLMAHIERVLEQYGDPKLLAYEFTKANRVS
jgi:hypothetical protein